MADASLQRELFYDIVLAMPSAKKATVVLSAAQPGQMGQGFLFLTHSVLWTAQYRKHAANTLCVYLLSELFSVSLPLFVEAALGQESSPEPVDLLKSARAL